MFHRRKSRGRRSGFKAVIGRRRSSLHRHRRRGITLRKYGSSRGGIRL